ncbi:MAG: hypothetical protein OXC10_12250 [Rhodospirillaceae bacterium]|nr:hypothetical protein [Rhodospirillaceae bacterium]
MTSFLATGAAWVAQKFAAEPWTISLHSGDPDAAGDQNELPTGGGRTYARIAVAAAGIRQDGAVAENDGVVTSPWNAAAADVPANVTWLVVRFGAIAISRHQMAEAVALAEGQPFEIAARALDLVAVALDTQADGAFALR